MGYPTIKQLSNAAIQYLIQFWEVCTMKIDNILVAATMSKVTVVLIGVVVIIFVILAVVIYSTNSSQKPTYDNYITQGT